MIRCLAIDDEPLALKQLAKYISNVPFLELVASCRCADDARQYIDNDAVDAIFIDINMPDANGLEFVRTMENPPLVVFTTAYADYAVDGFKVNAVDYLLKPFSQEEFNAAAAKLKQRYLPPAGAAISVIDNDNALYFKTEYKVVRVDVGTILFVEAMSEYLKVYTATHERPIVVLLSMKKLEERLLQHGFMRIHRSYIINLKHINEIVRNHVIMDDGTSLPIGELYKEPFMQYITSKFIPKK